MIPKCTSWRGHRFEGRYSYTNPVMHEFMKRASKIERLTGEFMRDARDATYERDICIHCGATVEKDK